MAFHQKSPFPVKCDKCGPVSSAVSRGIYVLIKAIECKDVDQVRSILKSDHNCTAMVAHAAVSDCTIVGNRDEIRSAMGYKASPWHVDWIKPLHTAILHHSDQEVFELLLHSINTTALGPREWDDLFRLAIDARCGIAIDCMMRHRSSSSNPMPYVTIGSLRVLAADVMTMCLTLLYDGEISNDTRDIIAQDCRASAWMLIYLIMHGIGPWSRELCYELAESGIPDFVGDFKKRRTEERTSLGKVSYLPHIEAHYAKVNSEFPAALNVVNLIKTEAGSDSASIKRLYAAVIKLLAHLAGPSAEGSVMTLAIRSLVPDVFDILLDNGFSVHGCGDERKTLLHTAVMTSWKHHIIAKLIELGVDVDAVDLSGQSPLHYAGTLPIQLFRLLLEKGADVNRQSNNGRTPAFTIIPHRNVDEHIKMLVEAGAKVYHPRIPTCSLLQKAYSEHMVDYLVAQGADVNIGMPLWHVETYQAVCRLLELGANPNIRKNGLPLLHRAIKEDFLEFYDPEWVRDPKSWTQTLVAHGADIMIRDDKNMTALQVAVTASNADAVELLLQHGADPAAMLATKAAPPSGSYAAMERIAVALLASGVSLETDLFGTKELGIVGDRTVYWPLEPGEE